MPEPTPEPEIEAPQIEAPEIELVGGANPLDVTTDTFAEEEIDSAEELEGLDNPLQASIADSDSADEPAATDANRAATPDSPAKPADDQKDGSPRFSSPADVRVLVVDDEHEIVTVVTQVLSQKGYSVFEATDGDEAIERILVHRPHVVILDVMMPGLSGWEVCRYVRQQPDLDGVRIIMATGIGEETNAATSPLYGADDELDKPFRLEVLAEKVEALVARLESGEL